MKMTKAKMITTEQKAEMEAYRKKNKNKRIEKNLYALILYAEGKSRAEISEKTGFCKRHITALGTKYRRNGISGIVENHYKGNHRNLSYEEEEAILEPFRARAEAGQMVEISEIKKAYDERIGRSTDKDHGRIYRVLERHNWRKIMP